MGNNLRELFTADDEYKVQEGILYVIGWPKYGIHISEITESNLCYSLSLASFHESAYHAKQYSKCILPYITKLLEERLKVIEGNGLTYERKILETQKEAILTKPSIITFKAINKEEYSE